MSKTKPKKPKNPVCAVWWEDAAYSFNKSLPRKKPAPQLTVGFVVKSTENFVNLTYDVGYNNKTGEITPERGVIIPTTAIIKFKKIDFLHG